MQSAPALEDWGCSERPILAESSSDCRNGSISSSLADNRSETFAMHFSINSRTPGSFTFPNDAGLIPFNKQKNDKRFSCMEERKMNLR